MAWLIQNLDDTTLVEQSEWLVRWHGWSDSWLVSVRASSESGSLTIELLNSKRQCRARSNFTLSDLIALGMPDHLDFQGLTQCLIDMCEGSMIIEDDVRIGLFRKKVVNLIVKGKPNGNPLNIESDCKENIDPNTPRSSGIYYILSVDQIEYDTERDPWIIEMQSNLDEKDQKMKVLKTSNHQWKEDLDRYEQEIENLTKEVNRLTSFLSEEDSNREMLLKQYKEVLELVAKHRGWDEVSEEVLFLSKLRRFARESHELSDVLHAQLILLRNHEKWSDMISGVTLGSEGQTALHLCAEYPSLMPMLRWVVTLRPASWMSTDPNRCDLKQRTPLNLACFYGNVAAVRLLLKHPEIDAQKADENGFSPLMWAAYENHPEVVTALLDHGRDSGNLSPDGQAAFDLARRQSSDEVIGILEGLSLEMEGDFEVDV